MRRKLIAKTIRENIMETGLILIKAASSLLINSFSSTLTIILGLQERTYLVCFHIVEPEETGDDHNVSDDGREALSEEFLDVAVL